MSSSKKIILAVDDDASVCELYEHGLPLYGYEVLCADSPARARRILETRVPDLVLMDVMMPGEDGITFTRELRSAPRTQAVPILVVSGLADAATLNDALLFGAVDYVVKPLELESLKLKIERAMAQAERRKSLGPKT